MEGWPSWLWRQVKVSLTSVSWWGNPREFESRPFQTHLFACRGDIDIHFPMIFGANLTNSVIPADASALGTYLHRRIEFRLQKLLVQRNGPVNGAETAQSGAFEYEGPARTLHRWGRHRRRAVDQPGTANPRAQATFSPDSFPIVGPGLELMFAPFRTSSDRSSQLLSPRRCYAR
ncbi:hypothetical protein BDP55DRAFT_630613 [Colletotrichum godetiae]|uniref:Uncharacterized protein n=1 Tax=Colletotrichum godetiae TaxID=1209918 RepID=A0AAJ0ANG1_9PEZI|nr:uncharacterized protein BDP55DRAFT_630613 [Colletotrichum godetiae]KAK1687419.1 hypothetical protein BDP55DRAFT_630613 [Colletotrichum godetiae]